MTDSTAMDLPQLRDRIREFVAERDWDQFHSPKNLSMALAAEVGELIAHFQWLTDAQSAGLPAARQADIESEVADVLIYLVRLADKLDIDLLSAANRKLSENARKYPVDKVRGSAKKYTEY